MVFRRNKARRLGELVNHELEMSDLQAFYGVLLSSRVGLSSLGNP